MQLCLQLTSQARMLLRAQEVYVPPTGNLSLRGLVVAGTQGMLCTRMCKRDSSATLCQSGHSKWLAHAGSFLRGVLEKAGVEPQVKRIGKYKSAGMPRPAAGCFCVWLRLACLIVRAQVK